MSHCGFHPPHQESHSDRDPDNGESETWIHQIDNNSTESSSTSQPTRAEEKEKDEDEDEQEERTPPSYSFTQDMVTRVSKRATPGPSATERQDQSRPPSAHDPRDTSTDVGGDPTTGAHPDLDLDDEGYVESNRTSVSFATTIDSAVDQLVEENERLYPNYGRHEYGLPVDEREEERMALQHEKFYLVLGGQHFLSPIGNHPQKILDLATGTGQWAVDVADQFTTATVIGVDVADIQPRYVAPNCAFEICDVEGTWPWEKNSFDLIHLRDPMFFVRDWPKLVGQGFEHLKPGGRLELACTYLAPASDTDSIPDSSAFRLGCEKLVQASKIFGTPADCPLDFTHHLLRAGFVHVEERRYKIPSCPWPENPRQKEIGRLEKANLDAGASAFGLRVFERAFGWTRAKTEVEMVGFRRDSAKREYRQYCPQ